MNNNVPIHLFSANEIKEVLFDEKFCEILVVTKCYKVFKISGININVTQLNEKQIKKIYKKKEKA